MLNFLDHLSQTQPQNLLSLIVHCIIVDKLAPILEESINVHNLSREYYTSVIKKIQTINRNYVIEDIFEAEINFAKSAYSIFEEQFKKEGTYVPEFWNKFYQKIDEEIAFRLNEVNAYIHHDNPLVKKTIYTQRMAMRKNKIHAQLTDQTKKYTEKDFKIDEFPFPQDVKMAESFATLVTAIDVTDRYLKTVDYYHARQSRLNILSLASAIKLYLMDNQLLPNALSELVPLYIKGNPRDPLDFYRPFNYVKTENGYRLYSVGIDTVDDLG